MSHSSGSNLFANLSILAFVASDYHKKRLVIVR